MTSIYIAGSWFEKPQYRDLRTKLNSVEIDVTSRWLDMEEWTGDTRDWPKEARSRAETDLADIESADVFVIDTRYPSSAGGYHTEFGYAYAKGKPIIIVGSPLNLFQYLTGVVVPDWDQAVNYLMGGRY